MKRRESSECGGHAPGSSKTSSCIYFFYLTLHSHRSTRDARSHPHLLLTNTGGSTFNLDDNYSDGSRHRTRYDSLQFNH